MEKENIVPINKVEKTEEEDLDHEVLRVISNTRELLPEMNDKTDEEILEVLSMQFGCGAWEEKS